MASENYFSSPARSWLGQNWSKNLLLPVGLIGTIGIILVPMPPMVMDFLLSFNLMLSVLILLTTIFVRKPLDFSVFPTVLLAIVMFRLGLNIASTRLILSRAEEEGSQAAGFVIEAFSSFVTSGSLVVGIILFLILLVIQFVVITKGAGRISEVSARFTLDGLPGKQMAIDAELQAGTLTKEEAQKKRLELGEEVDFFGAMDGASKFVRGDAIAGLVITFVNILGGLVIGLSNGQNSLTQTVETYTRLTIGDGLVSQLPAFLVAIGSAVLVTRSNREKKLGDEVQKQLFSQPIVLAVTGVFLLLMTLTPLPKIPLLILAFGAETLAVMLFVEAQKNARIQRLNDESEALARSRELAHTQAQVKLSEAILHETIELELGAELIPWTSTDSPYCLTDMIQKIRRNLAHEYGFLLPAVRIAGAGELDGSAYRVKILGSTVAEQVLRPPMLLALEGVYTSELPEGLQTKDPIHHLPAVWIEPEMRANAEENGCEILTSYQVLERHLTELILCDAASLLTHEDVQNLLDELAKSAPATVRDVVPRLLEIQEVQQVLQRLLAERVPIRLLGQILETLGRLAPHTHQPIELTEGVRATLGRLITSRCVDAEGILHVLTLSPALETKITSAFELTKDGISLFPEPNDQNLLQKLLTFHCQRLQLLGTKAVLLVSPLIRPAVWEMAQTITVLQTLQLPILSFAEVPKNASLDPVGLLDLPERPQAQTNEQTKSEI